MERGSSKRALRATTSHDAFPAWSAALCPAVVASLRYVRSVQKSWVLNSVQTSDLTSDMVAAACSGMLAEACVGPCKPYVPGLLSFRPCCSYLLPLQPVYVGAEAATNKQQLYISYPIK